MKVYIITHYDIHERWVGIESVYTNKKKAEKALGHLVYSSVCQIKHKLEELEISKHPQTRSRFN